MKRKHRLASFLLALMLPTMWLLTSCGIPDEVSDSGNSETTSETSLMNKISPSALFLHTALQILSHINFRSIHQ